MNKHWIRQYDESSLSNANNKFLDGTIIVTQPPIYINNNLYLDDNTIYNDYESIRRGRIEYGNCTHGFRDCVIVNRNPMYKYIEDCKRFVYYPNLWNQQMNDDIFFKNIFQNEAYKQIRRFDFPYNK